MMPKTLLIPPERGPTSASRISLADVAFAALALLVAALLSVALVIAALVIAALVAVGFVPGLIVGADGHPSRAFGWPSRGDRSRPGFAGTAKALVGWAVWKEIYGRGVRAGRVMRAAARFMPRGVGERWLGEAENFLSEAKPAQRAQVTRSYLRTAPQVIITGWAIELARRVRRLVRRS